MAQHKEETATRALIVNVLLLVIGLGVAYGIYAGLQFGYTTDAPLRVVISGSMIPKYNIGDVVVVRGVGQQAVSVLYLFNVPINGLNPADLKKGDDIIFWYEPYSLTDPIVHEIIQINANSTRCNGDYEFITHGIANPQGENEWSCGSISDGQPNFVIGLVTGSVPFLGNISLFLKTTVGLILIIALIGILLAIEILAPEQEDEPKQTRRARQSRP